MSIDPYANRRDHARFDVELPADLRRDADPEFVDHIMANLSLGGCFIKTLAPEPTGSMVMLRFTLPGDTEGPVVKAVGKVCWIKHGDDGVGGMGIQFVRIDDDDLTTLKRYIGGLLSGDAPE